MRILELNVQSTPKSHGKISNLENIFHASGTLPAQLSMLFAFLYIPHYCSLIKREKGQEPSLTFVKGLTLSLLTLRSLALSGLKSMSSISFSCVAKSCTWYQVTLRYCQIYYISHPLASEKSEITSPSPWQDQENSRPADDHHLLLLPKAFRVGRFEQPGYSRFFKGIMEFSSSRYQESKTVTLSSRLVQ